MDEMGKKDKVRSARRRPAGLCRADIAAVVQGCSDLAGAIAKEIDLRSGNRVAPNASAPAVFLAVR